MNLLDLLRSLRAMFAYKTRAALTLLGVVIGTSSIVLLAGLLRGGEEALVNASGQAVEADLIEVYNDEAPLAQRHKTTRALSRTDGVEVASTELLTGTAVGSEASHRTQAHFEGRQRRVTIAGAHPSSRALYALSLGKGRFFVDGDLDDRRRVCVVGHDVWEDLHGAHDDVEGVALQVDGQMWTVVGVLANKPILGSTTSTDIWNRRVLVPDTTYDALFSPQHGAEKIYVRRAASTVPDKSMRATIESVLMRRHLGVHNFKLREPSSQGEEAMILGVIKALLLSTGLLALFVGGINIMNVMLVTVTERTREIGVRRAVGATPGRILRQFLMEAATISLIGGLIGVATGIAASILATLGLRALVGAWTFHVEAWSIALGLGLSLVTGIVFGMLPAVRASKLDPIDALRFE